MKRKLINSISIIILLCLVAIPTYANQTIKIIVNGKIISCQNPPQIVNGRVMVPIRTVGEALNVDVDWQPESWYNGPVGPCMYILIMDINKSLCIRMRQL